MMFLFAKALSFAPSVLAMFETPNGQYPKTVGTVIKGNEGWRHANTRRCRKY